jgi:photosystem II stability/assembly factor-like uncharacterized protein
MSLRRLIGFGILLLATSAYAVDPALFQDLHWRLLGPFRGGRVLAVTGVPGEPEHFYFGSVNGGVWETRDAGRTWNPIFDGQPIGTIGAIAVAPSNPRVIYVGSGEADMRSDIAQGDGMYKSTDGGRTWANIGLRDSQQIGRILVDPANPDLVYVAALGHPYAANAERGVYRSRDGGQTWQKVLGGRRSEVGRKSTRSTSDPRPPAPDLPWDNDTGAIDLAFEPGNAKVIYAALWQTRRTPWSVYPPSNGPDGGLYKSTDGGETWAMLGGGLPQKPGRIGVAVAHGRPQRVYAVVDAEKGGMYRSDDGGTTWIRVSADPRVWGRGWYFGGVNVEPDNPDVVYSININVYRSEDAGKTFVPIKGAPGGDDYHQLWIDPQNPERRILGVDQGCVVSVNRGRTWSSWYNQATGQFYHVVTDNQFPYWVYGSQQDSGAAGIPSRTNTIDGINLMNFRESTAGGESDNVAPDPKDPAIIYGGRVDRLDTRTQQTLSVDPTLAYPGNDRRTWTLPLVFSPRDPRILYFANQRVFRTEDGGNHWSVISPDLTRQNPGAPPNLDPVTAALRPGPGSRLGVVYAIAPSRLAAGDLWAGTDDGQIWRTRDEGAHWTNITPPALTAWSKVGIIDASHFDAETAYAAIDRHRLDDFRPYVYRTHDGGRSWQLIASGIPDGSFVNAVREDAVRKGLLYAGTEKGVYVSFDDGDHWQPLQLNLPVTSARDLDVHGNDLVIATHGRAFWAIDDVTPLRQASEVTAAPYLFKPATAIRERIAGFTGTPMPKDEPRAANPPNGAMIDYVLPANVKAITLEVFDDSNNLVRRFTSGDPVPQPNLQKITTAPEWFVTPAPLKLTQGMHRFVWPLRYEAPAGLARSRRAGDGVWAPPGTYSVVLTVDGQRLTQPLTIAPDPRVNLPSSAYAEQFALARQVEAARAAVSSASAEAQAAMDGIARSRAAARGDQLKSLEALQARASEVSGIAPAASANDWWIPPKTTTSLNFLGTALQSLASAVDGADVAPTQDARESYAKLRAATDSAIAAWSEFKAKDLAKMNEQLKTAGIAPIALK